MRLTLFLVLLFSSVGNGQEKANNIPMPSWKLTVLDADTPRGQGRKNIPSWKVRGQKVELSFPLGKVVVLCGVRLSTGIFSLVAWNRAIRTWI